MTSPLAERPRPERVTDRVEFAAALTALREAAGLSVRDLARRAGVPSATVSGYVSGRHLPNLAQPEALLAVLASCGVDGHDEIAAWLDALRRVRTAPGRRAAASPAPYPGLASFEAEDAEFFFGRTALVASVCALVDAVRADASRPGIVIVTGPSGAGKSSVLRAGVVPAAIRRGQQVVVCSPGDTVAALDAAVAATEAGWTAADGLESPENPDGLQSPDDPKSGPLLLVVDQAEEIFAASPGDRAEFFGRLQEATAAPGDGGLRRVVAVLSLRADFYGAAAASDVLLPTLRQTQIVVGSMTRAELTEAITGPAAAVGLHVDDALVESLLEEIAPRDRPGQAHDVGSLPLLAHALRETWAVARRGRMTVDDYLSTGGIAGAVEKSAEAVWAELDEPDRAVARWVFLRLVFVADDSIVTRRRVPVDELSGAAADDEARVPGVIDRFVAARLLTRRADSVEISHEALLAAWGRLRDWVDADRGVLLQRRHLGEWARAWGGAGGDPSYLLRGARLQEMTELLDAGRFQPSDQERSFVDASRRQAVAQLAATVRRARAMRVALVCVVLLAMVASGLAVVAFRARSAANERAAEAVQARDQAQSRELAVVAARLRPTDPALAAQLSMVAYRVAPTVDATSALLDSTAVALPTRIAAEEGPTFVAVDRVDGVMAVTQSVSGGATLWSIDKPAAFATVASSQPEVQPFSVALSADTHQLAVGNADGLIERWDVSDPRHPRSLPGPGTVFPSGVLALAFSPDGRQLAAGGEGGAVQRWDVSGGAQAVALPKLAAAKLVSALAWAPDGGTLWAGNDDGSMDGWTIGAAGSASGGAPVHLSAGESSVSALAVSPDGTVLAAGDKGAALHVWRRGDGGTWAAVDAQAPSLTGWVDSLAFSPSGDDLAIGTTGSQLEVVSAADLRQVTADATPGAVTSVGFTDDGDALAGSTDGFARLWPIPGPVLGPVGAGVFGLAMPSPDRLLASGGPAMRVLAAYDVSDRMRPKASASAPVADELRLDGTLSISAAVHLAAVGAADGKVQLWDIVDPAHPKAVGSPFAAAPALVEATAFSPDGRVLAVGSDASALDLWDVSDPAHPRRLAPSQKAGGLVYSAAFQPHGTLVAAATTAGDVRLWDVADPVHPRHVTDLTGLTGYALAVGFSPDGKVVAAGGAGREIRLWSLADPAHPKQLGAPLTGPTNDVYALTFSAVGSTLAAVARDGVVWMWDVRDAAHPQLTARLNDADGVLYSVTIAPDGSTVAASGAAGQVWLWTADPAAATKSICAVQGAGITPDEWALYVHDRSYAPPCG
jgi:WD40 repeat protein/transcriptional regulator with XRE-family HTH domain